MRIDIDWLHDFVTLPGNTQELANTLTMLGLEADDGLDTSQLGDIIIGQVKECIKHPNADKLSLCKVYDGKDTLQIVCGAFNDNTGQKIAYDLVDRRAGDPANLYAQSTLALELLNWKAVHSDLASLVETTWQVYNR